VVLEEVYVMENQLSWKDDKVSVVTRQTCNPPHPLCNHDQPVTEQSLSRDVSRHSPVFSTQIICYSTKTTPAQGYRGENRDRQVRYKKDLVHWSN